MKKILLLIAIFSYSFPLFAQEETAIPEEEAIIDVIQLMFDGMRAGDSSMVSSAFADNIQMGTIFKTRKGEHKHLIDEPQKFLDAVGTPHDVVWDEIIWSYEVKIDGLMANVWTEYSFYAGDKFSHCGVNDFQLFNDKEKGWQIITITDTRTRQDCRKKPEDEINTLMDNWHKAAATADEDVFFGSMTEDGIYIGTDASERWLRDELKEWSKKYFDRESAWSFTPTERNVTVSADGKLAWFDELLDTWMGACRSSGVVVMTEDGWKIKHYHLSIAVPNDVVEDYLKILKEPKEETEDKKDKKDK